MVLLPAGRHTGIQARADASLRHEEVGMVHAPEHHWVRINDIRQHVVQDGPQDGPLVILPHGFPEYWYAWRRQIEPLAQTGYRVWAPARRGYNLSDKPRGLAPCCLDELAADLVGLIDGSGRERACSVSVP